MKKGVFIILLIALFLFPIIAAQVNSTQITNGISCLNKNVGDCSSLSLGEQIFTSLADGKCTSQVSSSSSSLGCWPSNSCDIKTTAQAVLAMKNSGLSTTNALSWLTSQEINSPDLAWYMQINTNANASCTITYSGSSYTFNIKSDKTIANGAGSCLSVSQNGYWLSVSSSCYNTSFAVTCNQQFTTTNLYQRQNYPTIYVSSFSPSAPSGGTVNDLINSSCFGSGGSCNYEGTLWASLALNSLGQSISPFLPYLTVMANDPSNQQYLPYSFLYALTASSDYLNTLLSQQNTAGYWDQSSPYGAYYDTALALFPLQSQNPPQKTTSVDWLMSTQGADGCWNSDNPLDTAFILYSLSGSQAQNTSTTTATTDCVSSGNYCLSGVSCQQAGGSILQGYTCAGTIYICCSKNQVIPSCASQSGQFCNSTQTCSGTPTNANDTATGQTCCIGTCTTPSPVLTPSNCQNAGGTCRNSCLGSEQSISQSCPLTSEVCCIQPQSSGGNIWIWILVALIALLVIALIFRNKLRVLWFRIKTGGKGGNAQQPRMPPRPPFSPGPPLTFQRRPMPPQPQKSRQQQKPSEVNDVLKKLREISK